MPNYDNWLNEPIEYDQKSDEEKEKEALVQEDLDYEDQLEKEWEQYDEQ